ncbi:hypothetical protein CDD79_29265 [Raoultella ornithinolytica]|nr:hypothetical protein CDD79_29265 [Raoultella ornithinolytica]
MVKKFLYICDPDHPRNLMLNYCCRNDKESQYFQYQSTTYQDNTPSFFRIMGYITMFKAYQQNISPLSNSLPVSTDKNITNV